MMANEDDEKDLELKDLIIQTLDANGILSKLKAQIRANVFVALDENEKRNESKFISNENQELKSLLQTREGRLAINLVRDFLEACNLRYTLSVFDPEVNTASKTNLIESRQAISKTLNLAIDLKSSSSPLLCSLIKTKADTLTQKIENETMLPNELSRVSLIEAKKKFDFYDKDKNGYIDKNELRTLFCDLYPNFNKNMLDRYVNDEFNATDKNFNNGIDFNEFKSMYQRLFLMCRSFIAHDFGSISNEKITKDLENSSEDEDMLLVSEITRSDLTESLKKSQNLDSTNNNLIDLNKFKTTNKISDIDISDELSSSSSSSFGSKSVGRNKHNDNKTPRSNESSKKSNNLLDIINAERNAEYNKTSSKLIDLDDRKSSSSERDEVVSFKKLQDTEAKQNSNSSVSSIASGKGFLKDAPSLFQKKNSSTGALKDIDKKIKNIGLDYDDENYDDDFTNGTTPRTMSQSSDKRRNTKSRQQTTRQQQNHQASDDEIDENILSYADESSKFDEGTADRSVSTVQGNHDADYLEDLSN